MKTLGQMLLVAFVMVGCAKSLSPAELETAFAKYEESEGKAIYREKCGKCHRYKFPETRTAEKWPRIIDRMAPKAKLTPDQKEAVLAFVTKNAKAS